MPIYEYRCTKCGHQFEVYQQISEAPVSACEQCGGMMQRTGSCYTCSSCGNNTGCG